MNPSATTNDNDHARQLLLQVVRSPTARLVGAPVGGKESERVGQGVQRPAVVMLWLGTVMIDYKRSVRFHPGVVGVWRLAEYPEHALNCEGLSTVTYAPDGTTVVRSGAQVMTGTYTFPVGVAARLSGAVARGLVRAKNSFQSRAISHLNGWQEPTE